MFSAFILIKLSVFLQIFTQIQSHSSYFVKIQSRYSNFHSNNHFFALVFKNLSKPRNFYTSAICDKFHVWLSFPWNGFLIEKKSFYISIMLGWEGHFWYWRDQHLQGTATDLIWMYFSIQIWWGPANKTGANVWQFMTDKPVLSCLVTYCTNAFWDDLTFLGFLLLVTSRGF